MRGISAKLMKQIEMEREARAERIGKIWRDGMSHKETKMSDPTPLKVKGDYSEHLIVKTLDSGEVVELIDYDSLTEDQIEKYCRDVGMERKDFPRMGATIKI